MEENSLKFNITKRASLVLVIIFVTTLSLLAFSPYAVSFAEKMAYQPQPLAPKASPPKDDGNDTAPPPAATGADVPQNYFGPFPSETQKELVGPYKLMKAAQVDTKTLEVTLPLYKGKMASGETVWYVLTDTNDEANAKGLGLNFSSKITYANVGKAVRSARLEKDGTLTFQSGKVDFSPERKVVPGDAPNYFPPKVAEPGSVGDADYAPLVRIENAGGYIYNAPMVAFNVGGDQLNFCDGNPDYKLVHDHVSKICPRDMSVTLKAVTGFSFAKPVLYLSFEASTPLAATLEAATLSTAMGDIPVGRDDSAFSAVERLFSFANGPTGKGNPQRQGLTSTLIDGGMSPINVFGGVPTIALDYSPMWDMNLGVWTQKAIDLGYRSRLIEEFQILGFAQQGWITGPDGKPFGSSGNIINCPVVMRLL